MFVLEELKQGNLIISNMTIAAVSYTHLDVYKRQGILGVLLYTQPSVAQKSVTDTVRLNFNIDSVARCV